jgi:hypothetical protein
MNPTNVELRWSAKAGPSALAVTYELENHGKADVWVADGLFVGGAKADRLVVMNGAHDVIRLVRGAVPPDAERVVGVPAPTLAVLAAGATAHGSVSLPLPLVAWNNAGKVTALHPARSIVLEVAVYAKPDGAPSWLRGEPLPAP